MWRREFILGLGGAAFEMQGSSELEPHLTLRLSARRLRCELIWRDSQGRVGVRFLPDQITVYDWLLDRGVRWRVYAAGLPFFALMPRLSTLVLTSHFRRLEG